MSWEMFKLSELRLDELNYRTGRVADQREAINAVIVDQDRKLVRLAEDILEMKMVSPGEPTWVTRDLDHAGMYIVLEGNRRVTALKLMENPGLAAGTPVERDFVALAAKYAAAPIRELEARVFPTREDAQPWLRRRHLGPDSGVGLERWKAEAKGRANLDLGRKAPRFLAVVDYLQDDSEEWNAISAVLDSKWTTVDRVLNTASIKGDLGVHIDPKAQTITFENGDELAGRALLVDILRTMAAPDFRFERVEKVEDRTAFLSEFLGKSVKVKSGTSPSPTTIKPVSPKSRPSGPSGPPKGPLVMPERTTLAPKSGARTIAKVDGKRLNKLYTECRKIELDGNENAAALLLRVFIELSSEALLIEKNVSIPAVLASKRGVAYWSDHGATLGAKVNAVLAHLDPPKKNKVLQPARVSVDPNSHAVASINTLHSYFHNLAMNPEPRLLREAWDGWEDYLRLLHSART